jgi:hypothetical protein
MNRKRKTRLVSAIMGLLLTLAVTGNVFAVAKAWYPVGAGDPSLLRGDNGALHSGH